MLAFRHPFPLVFGATLVTHIAAAPLQVSLEKRDNTTTNNNNINNNANNDTKNLTDTKTDNSYNNSNEGNSGGGNSNGAVTIGKVCRRSYIEQRQEIHEEHIRLVKRMQYDQWHHHSHHHLPPPSQQQSQPSHKQQPPPKPWVPSPKTVNKYADTKIDASQHKRIDNTTTNNINGSNNRRDDRTVVKKTETRANNNSGLMAVTGITCRRSLPEPELELERRELDTGASVLAALGGDPAARRGADDFTSPLHLLATRDLGKMAHALQVRALGHDADTTSYYKRHVGLECAPGSSDKCDEQARQDAHELLTLHARQLGFDLASDHA